MISLATVKTALGIENTDNDAKITATIPQAEAKYREVAGYDFNTYLVAFYSANSTTITLGGDISEVPVDSPVHYLKYGDIITGTGIPAETYITSVDKRNNRVTISAQTTDASDHMYVTTNISYVPTIARMIWFMIGEQSTTIEKDVASKSVGPLSITYGKGEYNSVYGLPQKIVDAIPKYVSMS